jgi:enoyl-CoA hydratase/carnithine racemase
MKHMAQKLNKNKPTERDFDELDFAVKAFQDTMMRIRYSNIPVIVAPHNMALGGGCELSMHADKVVAHAELYMGLVEFGVGLIPGGGGSKEFAKRLSDELNTGDIKINRLRDRFLTIGQAKVSTSAFEAFDLGYLREGIDEVVISREHQLSRAKVACLELANKGYIANGIIEAQGEDTNDHWYLSVSNNKVSVLSSKELFDKALAYDLDIDCPRCVAAMQTEWSDLDSWKHRRDLKIGMERIDGIPF